MTEFSRKIFDTGTQLEKSQTYHTKKFKKKVIFPLPQEVLDNILRIDTL